MTTDTENTKPAPALTAAAGSLLSDTDDEIRKLRSTGDPVFIRAAEELRQAANYAFPENK